MLHKMALYRVENVPKRGKGAIATTKISRGTLIVSEPPLIKLNKHFPNPPAMQDHIVELVKRLTRDQQRQFLDLYNSYPELNVFVGIVKTNGLPLGPDANEGGIFPICSKFNHSCSPNASYSWSKNAGLERVFAIKNIDEDEEICVSYLSEEDWVTPRARRQNQLQMAVGFLCCCRICSLPATEAAASDGRRVAIAKLIQDSRDTNKLIANPIDALKMCKRRLQLLAEEEAADVLVLDTYQDALKVHVAHGDYARASALAALAVRCLENWKGLDADGLEELTSYIKSPQAHPWAWKSNRWRSKVKFARLPGSDGFEEWLWERCG